MLLGEQDVTLALKKKKIVKVFEHEVTQNTKAGRSDVKQGVWYWGF